MKTFTQILSEATIKFRGLEGDRHAEKYIKPYLPGGESHQENSHTLASKVGQHAKGTRVTLVGHKVINGEHHVEVRPEGSKETVTVRASRLNKPAGSTTAENRGHKYESDFFNRAKSHGLVPEGYKPAGSTAGTDFPIINRKKKKNHGGRVTSAERVLSGEAKGGVNAAFGQGTIHFHPNKGGWHIPDRLRRERPEYAAAIEKSGVLEHMNKHVPNPDQQETTKSGRAKTISIKHPDLEPAKAYLRDHGVNVLQVGNNYGTYRVGKDETGHGLPEISGKGKWVVREKQLGNKRSRTVAFHPDGVNGLDKSHVNLDKDDHMEEFKKSVGVKG
jgi:hypothetical protein